MPTGIVKPLLALLLLSAFSSSVKATVSTAPSQYTFAAASVSGTRSQTSLTFTLSNVSTPRFVLKYQLDFSLGQASCTGTTVVNCTLPVYFLPVLAGVRQDAILVQDDQNNVQAVTKLYGSGLGAVAYLQPGTITTLAGTPQQSGIAAASVNANSARFSYPRQVAFDPAGNIYIADMLNNVVRKLDLTSGLVTVVAGTGSGGYNGDGISALSATIDGPTGLAIDAAGNIFIADNGNNRIRKVDGNSSIITTVAGGGTNAGSDGLGDGGPALGAKLYGPSAIAVDPAGNLFIADTFNSLIRKVNVSSQVISVYAGSGSGQSGIGDGGQAAQALLIYPRGIALDAGGNLYIADTYNHRIRLVNASTGIISTVAGVGTANFFGDGGLATNAALNAPGNVAVDAGGSLYIADTNNNLLRRVDSQSGVISTLAGTGAAGYSGDGMSGITANLNYPYGVAVGADGSVYLADTINSVIRKLSGQTSNFSFGLQGTSLTGPAQTLILSNSGTAALILNAIQLSGTNFADFTETSTCGASVPAGGSCAISTTFKSSLAGSRSAVLTIAAGTTGSPLTIALNGTSYQGVYDDTDLKIIYSGAWGANNAVGRYNGTQTYSNTAGDTASFTFTGTQVTYVYASQWNLGHAQVSIDGSVVTADLDEFAAQGAPQQLTYSGLSSGTHTITVSVLGRADANSSGAYVIVDAFLVGGPVPAGVYDDSNLQITYAGTWGANTAAGRYNGTQTFSKTSGSTASLTFTGTQVTYVYAVQSNAGHAQISIDGTIVTPDLDEFAQSQQPMRITYGGLTDGIHTITVTVLGRADANALDSYVIVDAFVVGGIAPTGAYDDTDLQVNYNGSWNSNTAAGRYKGTQTFSNTAGDVASLSFTGTQVTYVYEAQWNLGHAQVSIDGTIVTQDLDEYAAQGSLQKRITYSGLTNGTHLITVTVLGTADAGSAGSYIIVDAFLVGGIAPTGAYDDTDLQVNYNGSWNSNTAAGRYKGTQTFSNTAGDVASLSFTGTQVTYVYEAQWNLGHAQVSIDGTIVTQDLDEYAAQGSSQKRITYSGLTNGTHLITVTVLGTSDAGSAGSYIIVDGFLVGAAPPGEYDDSDLQVSYSGSWVSNTATGRYAGTQTFSTTGGDTATFTFAGTQVTYVYGAQSNLGHAQVSIDGTIVTPDLDEYAPQSQPEKKITYSGLTNGIHTITVTVLGRADASSTGSYIVIDGFLVGP